MIELALCMSVCLLICLGIIGITRLMGTSEAMVNAVHEGAKIAAEYYSSYTNNPSGLAAYVKSEIAQEALLNSEQHHELSDNGD